MKNIQTSPLIFLSYVKEDKAFCEHLTRHLSEPTRQGKLTLWSPQDDIRAGFDRAEQIITHLHRAALILLLLSSDYLADDDCYWQRQRAIEIGLAEPGRVCIILLRPCSWKAIADIEQFLFLPRSARPVANWSATDQDDVIQGIAAEIVQLVQPTHPDPDKAPYLPAPRPQEELRNPYMALRPFEIDDEPYFYGRDALVQHILHNLNNVLRVRERAGREQRLLSILGASGAGKSSLVHAGVLPPLIRGELAGSESWIVLPTLYPGDHPLDNLTDVLLHGLPQEESRKSVRDTLAGSTGGLSYLVNDIVRHYQPRQVGGIAAGINVVLVIDQFEEFLTQASQEDRQIFIDLLFTAATKRHVPLLIIVPCRIDFYQELIAYSDFFELMRSHEIIIKPMTRSEMRAAIEGPLQKMNRTFSFEAGLVERIIRDLEQQKEALPLLQFTLFEMFEQRDGNVLTLQSYDEIQGVQGAISAHAEKTYARFAKQQTRVRNLFLRLVKVSMDEDQELMTACQRSIYEQCLPANTTERAAVSKIIDTFVDARLLTVDRQGELRTLEISHEVLLRAWPRLKDWVHENEEPLYIKYRATQDARSWKRRGEHREDLYIGPQLQHLKKLQKQSLIAGEEPLQSFFLHSRRRQRWSRILQASTLLGLLLIVSLIAYTILSLLLQAEVTSHQIIITSSKDRGPGSLWQALQDGRPGEPIILDQKNVGPVIELQSDLNFKNSVEIFSYGVAFSSPAGQQIHIFPGVNVTFNGLVIKDSKTAKNTIAQDGVIFNQGVLILNNCSIFNNHSNYDGGALVNAQGGYLVLNHSSFQNNSSNGYGGAIYNIHGSVAINNSSLLEQNSAGDGGGGLYSMYGQVTILDSQITNNIAGKDDGSRYYGGGLDIHDALLSLTNSTIKSNKVYGDGGGISLLDASTTLNSSVITDNTSATSSNILALRGGGVAVEMSLTNQNPMQTLLINMPITDQPDTQFYIGNNHILQPGNSSSSLYTNVSSQPVNTQGTTYHATYLKATPIVIGGYPPPTTHAPETSPNYLGTIDIDTFCQTQGYSHGKPAPDNLALITCVSPFASTPFDTSNSSQDYPAIEACIEQYKGKFTDVSYLTARLYDYYDPSTWECYKDVVLINMVNNQPFSLTTGLNLDRFCSEQEHWAGLQENIPRTTAYDWKCQSADGSPVGISVTDACRYLTGYANAFDRLANFNDPGGWECLRPN